MAADPANPGQLSQGERSLYLLGGLMLAAAATRPRPSQLLSLLALGTGGYLAWRGAEGNCPVKALVSDLSGSGVPPKLRA